MNDVVLYEVPITLCVLALPFTGIIKWLAMSGYTILVTLLLMLHDIAKLVLLSVCTVMLVIIFCPWIIHGLFKMADSKSESPEYRAMKKKYRKAEKYFRKSLGDFMVQRDKDTWPHIDITISLGSAIIMVYDRSHGGVKLDPMKYVYKMDGRQIITGDGQILSLKDFEETIDNLLSPHTIEPPSIRS